jgi:hypothetical protein
MLLGSPQADKEAQFELKAHQVDSDSGGNESNTDFGLCRLVIVPALDSCEKPMVKHYITHACPCTLSLLVLLGLNMMRKGSPREW